MSSLIARRSQAHIKTRWTCSEAHQPSSTYALEMPVRTDEPNARTKHKVLSVSIEYPNLKGYRFDLPGTHQDSHKICSLLKDHFHYSDDDLTILIDDYTRPAELLPTRKNIENEMRKLVANAEAGDHYVFHFSGHGYRFAMSENLSPHEAILPCDVEVQGSAQLPQFGNYITDDIIHKLLVEPVQAKGAHFMMIFDCCHSASMAELPYHSFGSLAPDAAQRTSSTTVGKVETKYGLKERSVHIHGAHAQDDNEYHPVKRSFTHPPDVELWAACEDEELALGNRNGGLFMTAFTNVLGRNPYMTHQELLMHVTEEMECIVNHITKLRKGKTLHLQCPDLSCQNNMVLRCSFC